MNGALDADDGDARGAHLAGRNDVAGEDELEGAPVLVCRVSS